MSVEFVGERLTFTKDTDNPCAMFQIHMLGAVAQLERSLIRERQRQGIAIARGKKTYKGRLPVLNGEQVAAARASVALKVPKAQIARDLGVSRSASYDALGSRGAYANCGAGSSPQAQRVTAGLATHTDPVPVAVLEVVPDVVREPAGDLTPAGWGATGESFREFPSPASSPSTSAKKR